MRIALVVAVATGFLSLPAPSASAGNRPTPGARELGPRERAAAGRASEKAQRRDEAARNKEAKDRRRYGAGAKVTRQRHTYPATPDSFFAYHGIEQRKTITVQHPGGAVTKRTRSVEVDGGRTSVRVQTTRRPVDGPEEWTITRRFFDRDHGRRATKVTRTKGVGRPGDSVQEAATVGVTRTDLDGRVTVERAERDTRRRKLTYEPRP